MGDAESKYYLCNKRMAAMQKLIKIALAKVKRIAYNYINETQTRN